MSHRHTSGVDAFSGAVARIKQCTGRETDRAVADLLGLSCATWRRRMSLQWPPTVEVCELAERRPDLHLDVTYVLLGLIRPPEGYQPCQPNRSTRCN